MLQTTSHIQDLTLTLSSFRQILLDEMTKEDMDNLAKVVELDSEMNPQFVHDKLMNGEMVPWRAEGSTGTSIVVMEVKQKAKERVLYVWYLSGKGIVGNGHYILDTIIEFAKLHNCAAVEALTNLRFAKYLSRPEGGFKIKHAFVRKEVQ